MDVSIYPRLNLTYSLLVKGVQGYNKMSRYTFFLYDVTSGNNSLQKYDSVIYSHIK